MALSRESVHTFRCKDIKYPFFSEGANTISMYYIADSNVVSIGKATMPALNQELFTATEIFM